MNVLFLTLLDFKSFSERNIYCDLLREFIKNGHEVFCISPTEKRFGVDTYFEEKGHLLKLKIGNTQKTDLIEKGISILLIEPQFKSAIKKHFSKVKFDLVLYSTPPITFAGVIKFIKKRDNAKSYLLLKDIFPQNAVDLGLMTTTGIKSIIYKFFRRKEKQLYKLSDYIGCMSQANVDYVINNNPEVNPERVHICPNSIEVDQELIIENKDVIREKYGIPDDKIVFIYGGNLGKPQGIPFIIECLKANENFDDRFFVICGTGTDYPKLKKYVDESRPENVLLIDILPKDEYERLAGCCDVGLIFLNHRFTIPNFPSRLLSYMKKSMPVLACTDVNTDIGKVITENNFGWWCESNDANVFIDLVSEICNIDLTKYKTSSYNYLVENYTVENGFNIITNYNNGIFKKTLT